MKTKIFRSILYPSLTIIAPMAIFYTSIVIDYSQGNLARMLSASTITRQVHKGPWMPKALVDAWVVDAQTRANVSRNSMVYMVEVRR